jgi:hypothetical protein
MTPRFFSAGKSLDIFYMATYSSPRKAEGITEAKIRPRPAQLKSNFL